MKKECRKIGVFAFVGILLVLSSISFVSAAGECVDSDVNGAYPNGENPFEKGFVGGLILSPLR